MTLSRLALVVLLIGAALPVTIGLRESDLVGDEAIYAYAIDRMVDTGDWLTPRSSFNDGPFLEKPPLKLWILAAGMRAGLLPRDEVGMRVLDGLFSAVSFVYVYLLGRRLGGTACGLIAVLTLVGLEPLVFEHGLRSNNMEASVFLCYSGGLYHFVRWVEAPGGRGGRGQAVGVAAYFTLGFMTKFVAALFLPAIGVAAFLWRTGATAEIRTRWRDWIVPVVVAVVLSAPWFVYESWRFGLDFWQVIVGVHVYQRFMSSLDPTHVRVWHYYYSETWSVIDRSGVEALAVIGLARLAFLAICDQSWLARLLLVWGLLPMTLISIGTSKLSHYAYPFWPPIGLATGLAVSWILAGIDGRPGALFTARLTRLVPGLAAIWAARGSQVRIAFAALGIVMLAIAAWTTLVGPFSLEHGGVILFRSRSAMRAAVAACVFLGVAAYATSPVRLVGAALLVIALPFRAYVDTVDHLSRAQHPLRATRDCMDEIRARGGAAVGVLVASEPADRHRDYYYLWRTGPWVLLPRFDADAVLARLGNPADQTPVIIGHADYAGIAARLPPQIGKVRIDEDSGLLLPGPFAGCEALVLAAGGQPIWR